jgi:hypothetical protein
MSWLTKFLAAADLTIHSESGALRTNDDALADLIRSLGLGAASGMICGARAISSTSAPEPLVSAVTPCKFVWLGAPVDISTDMALNTRCILIGTAAAQTIPLMPSNFEGHLLRLADASMLYLLGSVAGESVRFAIFI